MFKADKGNLPVKIQVNFKKNYDVHEYNTRSKDNFFVRQTTTKLCKMSVNSKGIDLWNVLPNKIKNCVSINKFKFCVRKKTILDKY